MLGFLTLLMLCPAAAWVQESDSLFAAIRRKRRSGSRGATSCADPNAQKSGRDGVDVRCDQRRSASDEAVDIEGGRCDARNAAGAVLIAKLSLGALAFNDIWFGGQTVNPWLLEEGASGSNAGPGAATAAGLVGFYRQRDWRQHRQSVHALRRHRIATHLRPRTTYRGHGALLVAGQTRPHDP